MHNLSNKNIFESFISTRDKDFDENKIKVKEKYSSQYAGKIKWGVEHKSGCMGTLSCINSTKAAYFYNAFGLSLENLEKYVKIIINLDDFFKDHITDVKVTEKGIECKIKPYDSKGYNRMNLFLFYFFRTISLPSTKNFAYYVVKGVEEGLSETEALYAANFCIPGTANYFCFYPSYPGLFWNEKTKKSVYVVPFGVQALLNRETKNISDIINKIIKNKKIVDSFYDESKNKFNLKSSYKLSGYFILDNKKNIFVQDILNFYKKQLKIKDFKISSFYKELTDIIDKYSFGKVFIKRGYKNNYKNSESIDRSSNSYVIFKKKTKKQERFYFISKDGSSIHLKKKHIKSILI